MCLPVARVPPYNPLVDARDSTTPPFWSTGARTMATQSNLSPDTAADFSKHFIIHFDASKTGVRGVIVQLPEQGHICPIAFWSKKKTSLRHNKITQ